MNVPELFRWANREGWKVGPNAGRVLVELITYADEDGDCFPSRRAMAMNLYGAPTREAVTKSQLNMVSKALTALEDAHLIRRTVYYRANGSFSSNYYSILAVPTQSGLGVPTQSGLGVPTQSGLGVPTQSGLPEASSRNIQGEHPSNTREAETLEDIIERMLETKPNKPELRLV